MTHDTPGDEGHGRRWCKNCQIAVEPVTVDEDGNPQCPACGRIL